jgi:hypothetical protein
MQTWYPDALSNMLFLAVAGKPAAADQALYNRLVVQFDQNDQADRPTAIDDTSQYMWWAMAGESFGEPQMAMHFIQEYVSIEGKNNPQALASTAGELILTLTYQWNQTLWPQSSVRQTGLVGIVGRALVPDGLQDHHRRV